MYIFYASLPNGDFYLATCPKEAWDQLLLAESSRLAKTLAFASYKNTALETRYLDYYRPLVAQGYRGFDVELDFTIEDEWVGHLAKQIEPQIIKKRQDQLKQDVFI